MNRLTVAEQVSGVVETELQDMRQLISSMTTTREMMNKGYHELGWIEYIFGNTRWG